jgi:hypothetical protein
MPQAALGAYLTAVGALVALVALFLVLSRRPPVVQLAESEELTATEVIAQAVAAARTVVQDRAITDPRQAIVACFAAMEEALAKMGGYVAPRAADTPAEVLQRGIARAALPEPPSGALLELFREARFSPHSMTAADREAADRALTAILTGLHHRGRERAR